MLIIEFLTVNNDYIYQIKIGFPFRAFDAYLGATHGQIYRVI